MIVSTNTRKAYSEIDEFLELLDEPERNKVPEKLRKLFKEEKNNEYTKNINPNIPIKEQGLKEETLAIIALLNLQYWCENEEEKQRLKEKYLENENNYQEELLEQVNFNKVLDKKDRVSPIILEKEQQMILYKTSLTRRVINRIRSFFISKH